MTELEAVRMELEATRAVLRDLLLDHGTDADRADAILRQVAKSKAIDVVLSKFEQYGGDESMCIECGASIYDSCFRTCALQAAMLELGMLSLESIIRDAERQAHSLEEQRTNVVSWEASPLRGGFRVVSHPDVRDAEAYLFSLAELAKTSTFITDEEVRMVISGDFKREYLGEFPRKEEPGDE